MWRPDHWFGRRGKRVLIRLAQRQVSLLAQEEGGWRMLAQSAFDDGHHHDTTALRDAMRPLSEALPPASRVTMLCDSRWLPVFMLRTGHKPLSNQQLHALARHRLENIQGQEAAGWPIDVDYVPGDHTALAFALPTRTDAIIGSVGEAIGMAGKDNVIVQPTLAWVWNEVWRKQSLPADGWLVLAEQDRTIFAARRGKRLAALQAAAPAAISASQLRTCLNLEAMRFGLDGVHASPAAPIHGVSFDARSGLPPSSPQQGLYWRCLATQEAPA